MTTKRKPWMTLAHSKATCLRCGGASIWLPEIRMRMGGKLLTYWKWWKGFKQRHARCTER